MVNRVAAQLLTISLWLALVLTAAGLLLYATEPRSDLADAPRRTLSALARGEVETQMLLVDWSVKWPGPAPYRPAAGSLVVGSAEVQGW